EAWPAAHFSQDGSGDPNESAALVGSCEDGSGALGEGAMLGGMRQRIERFGIKDQRFGHALLAREISFFETAPADCSSSSRKEPSCSRSSSWEMARATKPDSPRGPTRRRTALARSWGML